MTSSVCSLSTEWQACWSSGIHPDSAKWMVSRKVKAVGLDTASLDYGQSKDFQSRKTLFKANIPGYVNLANLDKLPSKGATVFALPMKITHGTGGPLRIFAKLGGESHNRRWSESRRRTIVSDNNFPSYVQVLYVIILSYNKQHWRYRPITLLSVFHKITEKLMFNR